MIDLLLLPERSAGGLALETNGAEPDMCSDLRPWIYAGQGDLTKITPEALESLEAANNPPRMFIQGGSLVRLEAAEDGSPSLREVTFHVLRHELASAACFYDLTAKSSMKPVPPPTHLVNDILAVEARALPFPALNRIVSTPVFGPSGTLRTKPGYSRDGCVYLALDPTLTIPTVPCKPTTDDITRALSIIDDLLHDFPFVTPADHDNAIALFLLPFVRDLIDDPTPCHMVEAPLAGNGKGLLVDCLLNTTLGKSFGPVSQARDDEEWRKRITAQLLTGQAGIFIDNITQQLDSGALAAALTATTWQDRLLGRTKMVNIPVRVVWVATANNPVFTTELARRFVRIRLDSRVARPWERKGFKHKKLRRWARSNRGQLVWAALVLVQNWIAAGRPLGSTQPLGSYEEWSEVLGGILELAGITDFLGNRSEFYDTVDLEGAIWSELTGRWWETFGNRPVGVAALFELASTVEGLDLGTGPERAQKTAFGMKLAKQRDRVIGPYRVVYAGEKQRAVQWRLLPIEAGPQ